jgi:hypothetical protein
VTTDRLTNALGWLGCALWLALPPAFRDRPEPPLEARCGAPGCGAIVPWPASWCERAGLMLCPAHRPR